jgi:protein-tyrosine-phosphatase
MIRILFICTGNGGRSQIAASFAKKMAPEDVEIICAGDTGRQLHPLACQVIEEIGEKPQNFTVHNLEDIQYQSFDVVVTLCVHAKEICPTFPGSPTRIHWPLMDPTKMDSDQDRLQEAFKLTRDEIRQRVESLFYHDFFRAMQQLRGTLGTLLGGTATKSSHPVFAVVIALSVNFLRIPRARNQVT